MSTLPIENKSFVINMLVHSLLVFLLLTVFFWTYASKLITRSLNGQVDRVCSVAKKNLNESENGEKIRVELRKHKPDPKLYEGKDKETESINRGLFNMNILILLIFLLFIVALYAYYKHRGMRVDLKHIIVENILLLFFIALIEIWFFTKVARRFIPATPEYMMSETIDAIQDHLINNNIK
jgi:hypothetical protein